MTHDELRSLVEIKKDDLLNLCSDIIRIPSVNPPGDTDEMVQFICDYLKSHNIEYEIASGDGKTKNILARLGKKGGRVLILNGHCDVVPVGNLDRWDFDPFCGDIKDGKILGRGTSDMKGGLTGLLFAMGVLADNNIDLNGEVLLTVVPDEEAFGQGGTKWLVESGTVTGDACLIAEPTGYYNCEIGQKGTCSIKLMAHGTPAHGSLAPFIGDNAICKLLAVLNKVDCTTSGSQGDRLRTPLPHLEPVRGTTGTGGTSDLRPSCRIARAECRMRCPLQPSRLRSLRPYQSRTREARGGRPRGHPPQTPS